MDCKQVTSFSIPDKRVPWISGKGKKKHIVDLKNWIHQPFVNGKCWLTAVFSFFHKMAQWPSCGEDLYFSLQPEEVAFEVYFLVFPLYSPCRFLKTMLQVLFERVHILISLSADIFLYLQTLACGFFSPSPWGNRVLFCVCACAWMVKEEIPVSVWSEFCHTYLL